MLHGLKADYKFFCDSQHSPLRNHACSGKPRLRFKSLRPAGLNVRRIICFTVPVTGRKRQRYSRRDGAGNAERKGLGPSGIIRSSAREAFGGRSKLSSSPLNPARLSRSSVSRRCSPPPGAGRCTAQSAFGRASRLRTMTASKSVKPGSKVAAATASALMLPRKIKSYATNAQIFLGIS